MQSLRASPFDLYAVFQALFTKQGRAAFRTEKERDDWLNKEIAQLEMTVARKQQSLAALSAETQQLNSELMELSQVSVLYLADQDVCWHF